MSIDNSGKMKENNDDMWSFLGFFEKFLISSQKL